MGVADVLLERYKQDYFGTAPKLSWDYTGTMKTKTMVPPVTTVTKHRFTADKYHKMAHAGVLHEDSRVELLEGEIVEMAPIGSRHAACVKKLNQSLTGLLKGRAIVSVQDPVGLGDSEPEPDLALLEPHEHFYARQHPGPEDVLLVVEVADSSLEYDRTIKLPLYARAGVKEVWLVDLTHDRIAVSRDPSPQGYETLQTFKPGQPLSPLAFADLSLSVDDVLLL